MDKTLIIYDETGCVIQQITGSYRVPQGIPYLEVDIPEGKQLKITEGIGVDVSVIPHQVILENIPPTEVDVLKTQVSDLTYQLMMAGVI